VCRRDLQPYRWPSPLRRPFLFFPPLVLTGSDVGTCAGEFGRQSFTDVGVFDNLGVRMFRCLEHPLLLENPLSPDDFVDFQKFADTLHDNQQSPNNPSPLSRLKEILSTILGTQLLSINCLWRRRLLTKRFLCPVLFAVRMDLSKV
jgi:hypothetical protein